MPERRAHAVAGRQMGLVLGVNAVVALAAIVLSWLGLISMPQSWLVTALGSWLAAASILAFLAHKKDIAHLQSKQLDVKDATFDDGISQIGLHFTGDAADRLEAMAQGVRDTDTWLKERQEALSEIHVKIAERALGAIEGLERLSGAQQSAQAKMERVFEEVPLLIEAFRSNLTRFDAIDPVALDAVQSQLADTAAQLGQTVSVLETHSRSADAATAALAVSAEQVEVAAGTFSDGASNSVDAAQQAASSFQNSADDMARSQEDLAAMTRKSQSAMVRAIKGVMDSRNTVRKASTVLERTCESMALQGQAFEDALAANQSVANTAQATFTVQIEQLMSDLRVDAVSRLKDLRAALKDESSAAVAELLRVGAEPLESLGAVVDTHVSALEGHVNAVATHSDVLADARSAINAVAAMTSSLEQHCVQAEQALTSQLAEQAAIFAPLHALAEPAKSGLEAIATLDKVRYPQALEKLEKAAETLTHYEPPQTEQSVQEELERLAARLAEDTAQTRAALATFASDLRANQDTVQHDINTRLEAIASDIDLNALKTSVSSLEAIAKDHTGLLAKTVETVQHTLETSAGQHAVSIAGLEGKIVDQHGAFIQALADLQQHIGHGLDHNRAAVGALEVAASENQTALGEVLAQTQKSLANTAAEVSQASAATARSQKALKTQVVRASDQSSEHFAILNAAVKDLRSTQMQSLKHALKSLPQSVAEQLGPQIETTQDTLIGRLEALQMQVDAITAPESAPEDQEPELTEVAMDLSQRLQAALSAMEQIEAEVTGLASAALAAPDDAGASDVFSQSLAKADDVLIAWGNRLDNVATAIALARDAA